MAAKISLARSDENVIAPNRDWIGCAISKNLWCHKYEMFLLSLLHICFILIL